MPYRRSWVPWLRPRGRLVVLVAALVGVGLLVPRVSAVLSGASNTANVTAACATPAQTAATAAAPAGVTQAAATPAATAAPAAGATAPAAAGTAAPAAASAAATPAAAGAATPTTAATPAATAAATTATSAAATPATPATPVSAAPTPCPAASASVSATPTAAAAAAGNSCDIVVPANPLTAQGLATPYQLTGPNGTSPQASGCTMANAANLGAFVQATILDPATGKLSVYEPLVITQGTTPAAPPVVPTLPANAVVAIDFGFNGTNLTQVGATATALAQGNCVNGLNGSIFGQVSFCNGTQFFRAAFRAERRGLLTVPSAGTSPKTGQPCPTTRSFTMIDQDQSDNVTSIYLLNGTGQTAQMNAANVAALPNAAKIANGSDNILLDGFLDPTLGCTPFTAPDLSQAGTPGTSQVLDELSAAQSQAAPIALVPESDEMVLVNNAMSAQKTNLYRSNVGQPPISFVNNMTDSPANYCQNMVNIQTPFLSNNQAALATGASPAAAVGNNLLTFLANRMSMSFTNLNCQNFGLQNPITVTLDGNGAAIAATFNTAQQTVANQGAAAPPPAPAQRMGRPHHRLMNPSGA